RLYARPVNVDVRVTGGGSRGGRDRERVPFWPQAVAAAVTAGPRPRPHVRGSQGQALLARDAVLRLRDHLEAGPRDLLAAPVAHPVPPLVHPAQRLGDLLNGLSGLRDQRRPGVELGG